jgi:hypothetical protein
MGPSDRRLNQARRDYRHQIERAIAFFDGKDPVPPARAVLRARLDAVLAEQDERARLAHA